VKIPDLLPVSGICNPLNYLFLSHFGAFYPLFGLEFSKITIPLTGYSLLIHVDSPIPNVITEGYKLGRFALWMYRFNIYFWFTDSEFTGRSS